MPLPFSLAGVSRRQHESWFPAAAGNTSSSAKCRIIQQQEDPACLRLPRLFSLKSRTVRFPRASDLSYKSKCPWFLHVWMNRFMEFPRSQVLATKIVVTDTFEAEVWEPSFEVSKTCLWDKIESPYAWFLFWAPCLHHRRKTQADALLTDLLHLDQSVAMVDGREVGRKDQGHDGLELHHDVQCRARGVLEGISHGVALHGSVMGLSSLGRRLLLLLSLGVLSVAQLHVLRRAPSRELSFQAPSSWKKPWWLPPTSPKQQPSLP